MNEWPTIEEARFQIIRAALEEYPSLRKQVIKHLKRIYPSEI